MNLLFERPFSPIPAPSILSARRLQERTARLFGQRPTDRLFFAVLPDPKTAVRISDLACRLKVGHELTGRLLRPEHLHVTLFHVRDSVGLSSKLIDAVVERAASVAMPKFKVAFDRVGSFKNGAFVLRGDEGTIGLEILQQRLSDTLEGRIGPARPFTPHVTLLRDSHRVEEHAIQPIEWNVGELVLVHSLLGRTEHRHVARLPLA